jgi:hypothetical protein
MNVEIGTAVAQFPKKWWVGNNRVFCRVSTTEMLILSVGQEQLIFAVVKKPLCDFEPTLLGCFWRIFTFSS